MRVLIVKTSSMGDLIHTLPAITDAQSAIPGIRFDWVSEAGFAEVPTWHPAVDKVIPVSIRRWRKSLFSQQTRQEWKAYKSELQSHEYDLIIDAQGLVKSAALVARLAKGPKAGFDKQSAREPLASRFYDRTFAVDKRQHAVERIRQLFAQALGYELPTSYGQANIQATLLASGQANLTDTSPYLVFLHSTTRHEKHWPENYWEALIKQAADAGWTVKLPWGSEAEQARAKRLAEVAPQHAEVLPKLSLTKVAEVLAGASAVVSVDTGLAHLTAALDKNNVILYASTNPELIGGYGANQVFLQAKDCPPTDVVTDPIGFAPLTPDIVWQTLCEFESVSGKA